MVIFKSLTKEALRSVVQLELAKLQKRLTDKKIELKLDPEAVEFLVSKGFQPEMGARPVRRTIEEHIEDVLAEKLLQSPSIKVLKRGFQIKKGKDNLEFTEHEMQQDDESKDTPPEKALAGEGD